MEKKEVRKKILDRRHQLTKAEQIQWDDVIHKKLRCMQPYIQAKTVMCYVSFGTEVDTLKLIEAMILDDKRVCVPRFSARSAPMEAVRISGLADLVAPDTQHGFKIRQPHPRCQEIIAPACIDLFFIPVVAFDKEGGRIGYGKGYYDRYCARLDPARLMGLAYDFQGVEAFVKAAHDVCIPTIDTESRIVIASNT